MTFLLYPFTLPPVVGLNIAQMDGRECVYCPGDTEGRMRPVGRLRGTLVFAHVECANQHRLED